jgi:hypothetical protein
MAATEGIIAGLLKAWARPAAGAVVGAVVFFIASQVMSRAGGTCIILCNPLVAVPYGALLGVFASGGPMKADADGTPGGPST